MPVTRRLVAVVAADVVGYSRLMERDEAGTHERLRKLREELIDPKIAEHGGRTVKTTGDGMLLEFPSATSALRCAVEVQREMGVRNLYLAPDERIALRIGINLGDIIVEGADIVGDGVNVAARLETLAEPGGICVASAIWEQVHEDLGIEFVDAGEQQVKNISKPIHVYRVALGKGSASGPTPKRAAFWGHFGARRAAIVAAVLVAVTVLAAVIGFWLPRQRATTQATAVDEPPLRSVLILPFEAAPGDPALAETARRLTADVTHGLADSLGGYVSVVPASVAAEWAGKGAGPRSTGLGANVRFLLQGELRPSESQFAVTLRLVDTRDGRQLQTERRTIERNRLDDYDALARGLTSVSRVMLNDAVSAAVTAGQGAKASPQDLITRAFSLTNSDPIVQAREQLRLADEAIKLDPNFASAWSIRAGSNVQLYLSDFSVDRERLLADADADSLRAVTLDGRDAFAWATRGSVLGFRGNIDAAFVANDRSRELDPTRFFPVMLRGYLYLQAGRPAEALTMVELRQRAVGTLDPEWQELACRAHVALGNYEAAIAACERAAAAIQSWSLFASLTAAYAMRGDVEKATQAKARLLKLQPAFTIGRYEAKRFSSVPSAVTQDKEHLLAGLRKAGVPE